MAGTPARRAAGLGDARRLDARRPLVLGRGSVLVVEEGEVDLFWVHSEAGSPAGSRLPLLRLNAGEVAFGLEGDERVLLAVGLTGSRARLAVLDQLVAEAKAPETRAGVAALLEVWVERLAACLARGRLAPGVATPAAARELELDGGTHLLLEAFRWATVRDGAVRWLSRPECEVAGPGSPVPVCRTAWLTAVEPARLALESTAEFLASTGFWPCFETLMAACARVLDAHTEERRAADRERLAAGAERRERLIVSAIGTLGTVLQREGPVAGAVDDLLLAACRLVGRSLGLEVRAPAPGTGGGDPLRAIARASGFRMRSVLLEGEWWRRDAGPLLAFLAESGRPVALLRERGRYVVRDPGSPARPRADTALTALRSGAVMLYRPFPDTPLNAMDLLRFGLAGARPDLMRMALMATLAGLLSIAVPYATGLLFDAVIPGGIPSSLALLVAGLLVAALASTAFQLVRAFSQLRLDGRVAVVTQAALWDRMLCLPTSFFRRYTAGDLASRALGISTIQQLVSASATAVSTAAIVCAFNLAFLFFYSLYLALAALAIVALGAAVAFALLRAQLAVQRPLLARAGSLQGFILQALSAIGKLRVAGAEPRAFALWAGAFAEQKRLDARARNLTAGAGVLVGTFPVVCSGVIFALVALADIPSIAALSPGRFLGFLSALTSIVTAISTTVTFLFPLLQVVPIFERISPMLETLPERQASRPDAGELSGALEVSHVCFRYVADGPLTLDDVSFTARRGEFVALVGPSGSGKSTICRLLLGFDTPESGTVSYDGRDLATLDLASVRRQMGVVLQGGKLLAGSILDNIVGATGLTEEDAWEAARLAGVDEDIALMPMSLHTIVGHDGVGLSGGQIQRLLIARALVRRPRILLFDEATSALDNRTQAIVSASLERLRATRIAIAHRLSTIRNADKVLVVVAGRVVESGSFDEVMGRGGVFTQLARRQLA